MGFAAVDAGLGRSSVPRRAFRAHRRTPEAGARTLALLYAADLTDQVERRLRPALSSGFVVVADRWTPTARARCLLRGASPAWLDALLPAEPLPDLICYLDTDVAARLQRQVHKRGLPDFRESGRDLGLHPDPLRSFVRYQHALDERYAEFGRAYGAVWRVIPAGGDAASIQSAIRRSVTPLLRPVAGAAGPSPEPAGGHAAADVKARA
jgi:thymidylate kinase